MAEFRTAPGGYVSPIEGTIADNSSGTFGAARSGGGRKHAGNDFQTPTGSPALAVVGGKVIYVGDNQGYRHNFFLQFGGTKAPPPGGAPYTPWGPTSAAPRPGMPSDDYTANAAQSAAARARITPDLLQQSFNNRNAPNPSQSGSPSYYSMATGNQRTATEWPKASSPGMAQYYGNPPPTSFGPGVSFPSGLGTAPVVNPAAPSYYSMATGTQRSPANLSVTGSAGSGSGANVNLGRVSMIAPQAPKAPTIAPQNYGAMSYYDMATGNQRSDGVMNGATLPPMTVRKAAPTGPGQPRIQLPQIDIPTLRRAVSNIAGSYANPAAQQRPAPGGGFLPGTSPPGGGVGVVPAPYYGSSVGSAIGPTWSGTSPTPSGGPNYNATISPNGKTVSWTNANGQTFTSQRFGF